MQNTYPKGIWDDLIVLMLMLQPFISNVSDNFQITIEIILIIMLSINLVHYKFNSSHIFIIYCFH